MSDFKATPKMKSDLPCFKEGGSIQKQVENFTKRDRKSVELADTTQDKAIVKKAFGQHDKAKHGGSEPTEIKLKKGGRSKKETGTVKKYKTGGSVDNEYSAKKASGDLDRIAAVKDIKPGKAAAPSKASVKPNFGGSDVEKEKSKPAGHKDPYIKSKQSGKAAAALSGAKGPDAFKKGGKVKKMATGGSLPDALAGGALGGGLAGMVQDQERKKRMAQYLSPTQQAQMAQQQAAATAAQPPAPNPMPQAPGGVSPAGPVPTQKKGGKVKGKC